MKKVGQSIVANVKNYTRWFTSIFVAILTALYPFGRVYLKATVLTYERPLNVNMVHEEATFWKQPEEVENLKKLYYAEVDSPHQKMLDSLFVVCGIPWLDFESYRDIIRQDSSVTEIRAAVDRAERERVKNMWPWWRAVFRGSAK